jgi:diaminopimelate epimerase
MHGTGNDFVLLDLREQDYELNAGEAARLADRHLGIGCDQLLALRATQEAGCLVEYEVWNADGSRALQCGNGIRCIGLYLHSRGEASAEQFSIRGPAGNISLQAMENGQFRVNMGHPSFEAENVPVNLEQSGGMYELEAAGQSLRLGAVSMGNPHAVLEVPEISTANVTGLGAAISSHPAFPQGCNAGFAQILDRKHIRLRVYERGAAETRSCGSGACAAAVVLIRGGKVDKEVLVNQKGGTLMVEWLESSGPVMMTGPAVHLFVGMLP